MIENIKSTLSRLFPPDTRVQHRNVFGQSQVYQHFGIQEELPPSGRRQRNNFRGVFFRGITTRSNLISKGMMGFSIERITGQNETEEVETNHPWVQLLFNPAAGILPAKIFYKWASENYDLTGHADMIVERDGMGVPIRLLPVFQRFGNVIPLPAEDGGVAGWVFMRSDGKRDSFAPEDVIRIGRTSPYSPWDTVSLLQAALLDLDAETFIKEFRRDSVKTGGITSPILSGKERVTSDQAKEYSQRLKKFMGHRGMNEVLVLGDGLTPVTQTSKELEAVSGLVQTKEDIREILGIPSGLFQGDANRASANSLRAQFIEDTIEPELEDIAAHFKFGLERAFHSDGSLTVGVPDLRPMDLDTEIRWRRHLLETGQRVIDDLRGEDGIEEVPDGQGAVHYVPPSFIPVEQANQVFTFDDSPPEEPEREEDRSLSEERLTILWRTIDRQKRFEKGVAKQSVIGMFDRWRQMILTELGEQTRDLSVDKLIDLSRLEQVFEEEMTPAAIRAIRRGFETSAKRLDLGLAFSAVEYRSELDSLLSKTKSVQRTVKDKLGSVVEEALRESKTPSQVRGLITEFFETDMVHRADMVAQTMANSGFESGQLGSFKKAGIGQKRWLSQRDGKQRDSHDEADGQVVSVNDSFVVGGIELKHPGDPDGTAEEVIRCRCSQLPVRGNRIAV